MSKYTTGEIAKLCGVTVRTVQYYDSRGILTPSQLSEGGRRLYAEEDLQKMKIICFLRELDLSLNAIAQLLSEAHPEKVIDLLLEQQGSLLRAEIKLRQEKLEKLTQLQQGLKTVRHFSFASIGEIAMIMESKKKLRRLRWTILAVGMVAEAFEVTTALLWALKGIWWPFAFVGMPVLIGLSVWVSVYYFKNVAYICPECHQVFKPRFWAAFWANHTPTTRKLTCLHCGHKGFCVETYKQEEQIRGHE